MGPTLSHAPRFRAHTAAATGALLSWELAGLPAQQKHRPGRLDDDSDDDSDESGDDEKEGKDDRYDGKIGLRWVGGWQWTDVWILGRWVGVMTRGGQG